MTGVTNGTLFKISHGDIYEVNFVEEADFTADPAGTPYLVQAIADGDIVFDMKDVTPVDAPIDVQTAKGFVASLQEELQDVPEGYDYLLVSGGALHSAGPGCHLSKNHAYIDINYVPAEAPAPQGAPRRVTLYNVDAKSPTALGQMNINESKAKKVIDKGQFVIIRDNMKYNAQGVEIQ